MAQWNGIAQSQSPRSCANFGMPPTIDYLSLDIEGAEAWVFQKLSLVGLQVSGGRH
jgi:hypothetical protein